MAEPQYSKVEVFWISAMASMLATVLFALLFSRRKGGKIGSIPIPPKTDVERACTPRETGSIE